MRLPRQPQNQAPNSNSGWQSWNALSHVQMRAAAPSRRCEEGDRAINPNVLSLRLNRALESRIYLRALPAYFADSRAPKWSKEVEFEQVKAGRTLEVEALFINS